MSMQMDATGAVVVKRVTKEREKVVLQKEIKVRKEKGKERPRQKMVKVVQKVSSRKVIQAAKAVGSKAFQGKAKATDQTSLAISVVSMATMPVIAGELSVRQVQNEVSVSAQPSQQTSVAAGSPSSTTSSQVPVAPQHGRVARIQFADAHVSDVSKHDELVFDLRSPVSDSSCLDGTNPNYAVLTSVMSPMRTEFDVETCLSVRAMLESVDEHTQMHSILLDSGADASVFPACMAELGVPSGDMHTCLRDAQGKQIPFTWHEGC